MLDDRDPTAVSPEDVEAILAALDRLRPGLSATDQDTLAFNVLVNALGSVLERLRHREPEQVPTYVAAAQALLGEV